MPSPDHLECSFYKGSCGLVSDDGTPVTGHLVQILLSRGWNVVVLSFPETILQEPALLPPGVNRVRLADLSETHLREQLQGIHQKYGAIRAFIHLNPLAATEAIAKVILKQVFFIAKHLKKPLNEAAQQGRSWVVTVSRLDGELGVSQRTNFNPIDSGLLGLTKTLNLEWPQVFCRAVDISPEIQPQAAAKLVVDELYDPNRLVVDVGYGAQGRQTLVCQRESISAAQKDFNPNLTRDSVFLVSGGGRGITAQCVIRLAQAFHCQFILLGRSVLSPEPSYTKGCEDERELKRRIIEQLVVQGDQPTPVKIQTILKEIVQGREIRATLAQIEEAGGRAIYLSVDIRSDRQVRAKVAEAEQTLGKITGMIHGAGNLADKLIEYKTEQDFESVYTPKIEGLKTLLDCVDVTQLKHLVLFTSAAGFYGNIGQADYAIANEILNRFAHQFKQQNPDCHVSAFNWGPWDGGMVTPELKQIFKQRDIEVIPVEVGTQMLVEELAWGDQQTVQILVGSPLVTLSEDLSSELNSYLIRRKLTLAMNPLLQDHIIGEYAVLPITFAAAWMANTCEQLYPGYKFFKCLKLKVLKGIVFDASLADEYLVEITEINKSSLNREIDLKVIIRSETASGKPRYHYSCQIQLLRKIPDPPIYLAFDNTADTSLSDLFPYQDKTLFHGSSFQGITKILNLTSDKLTVECILSRIADQRWGQISPQAFNPIAADTQFQCLLVWAKQACQSASLPSQFKLWEEFQFIAADQPFYVSMIVQSSNLNHLITDITFHDNNGKIYSRIFGAEVTISRQLNQLFINAKSKQNSNLLLEKETYAYV